MREKLVTHPGIIKQISGGKAEVTVITKSACSSCEIKGSCNISETKEKIIEVELQPGDRYENGQQVTVEMKQSLGSWAVLLGYFFPFLVVVLGLVTFVSIGFNEGISGLLSLGLLGVYYLGLYSMKGFLKSKFSQRIRM